jgi:hypothetical protein
VPASTLRHAIEALDQPGLASCWTDDMTLGWVYQYWNDPEREALDAKLNDGGKVEPHEIASKTQMFTERYMVDWLLQNSLGPMWLAMCSARLDPEVEGARHPGGPGGAPHRLAREARGGEVALTELMPLHTDAERRWAYYVPQPLPADAVAKAPPRARRCVCSTPRSARGTSWWSHSTCCSRSTRRRPATAARPTRSDWSDAGDRRAHPRAQPAWHRPRPARGADRGRGPVAEGARRPALKRSRERLNLVAANLRLAGLPKDDPALVELRREVERETGIPGALTDTLVEALRGADHLGSLLRVDEAVEEALDAHEQGATRRTGKAAQGEFGQRGPRAYAEVSRQQRERSAAT